MIASLPVVPLELAAVAAYQNVERTAEDELDMTFPDDIQRVEP